MLSNAKSIQSQYIGPVAVALSAPRLRAELKKRKTRPRTLSVGVEILLASGAYFYHFAGEFAWCTKERRNWEIYLLYGVSSDVPGSNEIYHFLGPIICDWSWFCYFSFDSRFWSCPLWNVFILSLLFLWGLCWFSWFSFFYFFLFCVVRGIDRLGLYSDVNESTVTTVLINYIPLFEKKLFWSTFFGASHWPCF
jgi:hypothetical protein